ncbi:hypothetical protein LUZ60_007286 [Juncus effusus]|nr:hypothetical protein LUZ60_007286 [Juncus effusus]
MDDDIAGGGGKLGKKTGEGEVDLKSKSGTAWSHNFLNQKPWHPLSYPNQRRKWIAEQTNATRQRRAEEVAREFAQEQQFFRQTALFNKKDKDKVEMMKAVSFMYVRPPGYNPESAKAAEIADQNKSTIAAASSTSIKDDSQPDPDPQSKNQKSRPKDVYGRALPTENEFEALKNAPKMDTGIAGRSKPFGIEIRNVRCVRCNAFGHQSGDRECPLKDAIMPNDETRLKRDDPLNVIKATSDANEPLKWELKVKPGLSPPRGGFDLDDPNQQILPDQEEEIFDEYGGFLGGGGIPIPALISDFYNEKPKKKKKHSGSSKRKHKRHKKKNDDSSDSSESEEFEKKKKKDDRSKSKHHSSTSESSEDNRKGTRSMGKQDKYKKHRESDSSSSEDEKLHQRRDERRKKREHVEYEQKKERDDKREDKRDYKRDYKREDKREDKRDYKREDKREDKRDDKSSRKKNKDYGNDSHDDEQNRHRHHHHHYHYHHDGRERRR